MAGTVHVNLGERAYDIQLCASLDEAAPPGGLGGRALLVSDDTVAPLYAERAGAWLRDCGLDVVPATVPAGEGSKSLEQFGALCSQAVEAGLDRDALVVALGGGVVGDLAGFVAASFLRGVKLLQMPTTLLAMVDSSVGGKTAINIPQGKNLVGAFHQPVGVVADLSTLRTLPVREFAAGLAEVVKYGAIWDGAFFGELERAAEALLAREPGVLSAVVARCCEIKAEVVAMDERESGVRAVLNFGHTLGHALEAVSGYDSWLHGEAIALGMVYAAGLSVREKGLAREQAERLGNLLARFGLPVALPSAGAPGETWGRVRRAMAADKKARERVPRWVLAEELGSVVFGCEVPEERLESAFARLCGGEQADGSGQ